MEYFEANDIEPSGQLIDLGCGLGRNAFLFAEKGFQVTAVDFSQPGNSRAVFCDTTAIDTIAYLNSADETPRIADRKLAQTLTYRNAVFMMEPLDLWVEDGQRIEESIGRDVHKQIPAAYFQQGYSIISIPAASISKRADIIEDYVSKDHKILPRA